MLLKIKTMFVNRKGGNSVSVCMVCKIESSVSIVNLGKSASLCKRKLVKRYLVRF